jgi:hypothetical protein
MAPKTARLVVGFRQVLTVSKTDLLKAEAEARA